MADALVSIVIFRLTSVIQQRVPLEISGVMGFTEIRRLTEILETLVAVVVLADAEERQVYDPPVRIWLDRVKDMAYEMHDILDECSTAILKLEMEEVQNASMLKKVRSCFLSPCLLCKQVISRRHIALKIRSMKQKVDEIANDKRAFNFSSTLGIGERLQLRTTFAIENISEVYEREMDRDTLLKHLLDKKPDLLVVSIVGTGRMGKTRLAQQAYNSPEVKAHFPERIWVCVSDHFSLIRIFKAIVEGIQKESCNLHGLEALRQKVQTCIARKKFLLVLDDVWTENHQLWEQFNSALKCGAVAGSRILATTRNERAAQIMGTTYVHPLGELSWDQSRELFHQIAFSERSKKSVELEGIGEEMVKRCKGLPLVIKILGALMRSKHGREEWENVLNSRVWQIDAFEKHVSPVLFLSYYNLPLAIKLCFSYCAVFPKDEPIEIEELIKLWMAQNYIDCHHSEEIERVGRDYFKHLAALSLFHDLEKDDFGNIIRCKMPEMVHNFAQFLTQNECFIVEVENDEVIGPQIREEEKKIQLSFQKGRHASLIVRGRHRPHFVYNGDSTKSQNLHTLLVRSEVHSLNPNSLSNLFLHLTRLRALDLGGNYWIEEIPKEIGNLIHLRYLNLSSCYSLELLPETICDLYNLQTLKLDHCGHLRALPHAMHKLRNLRHLQIFLTYSLEGLPKGIGRLVSLRTLEKFIVSGKAKDGGCKIGELRNLNNLRGSLEIKGLDKVKDEEEAAKAKLKDKEHLYHLALFDCKSKSVIDALQPHPNLSSLHIHGYNGIEHPIWMNSCLSRLQRLKLIRCCRVEGMPPLGELPYLEILEIGYINHLKSIGNDFLGSSRSAFPFLKKLSFWNMDEWEKWQVDEEEKRFELPFLHSLEMYSCPKLEALPDYLLDSTTLQELKIDDCPLLQQLVQKRGGRKRLAQDISYPKY